MPRLTQKITTPPPAPVDSTRGARGFVWSEEQEAVFTALRDTDDNLLVNATAGSGKTATECEAARQAAVRDPLARVIYLAFAKSNQLDAQPKLGRAKAMTFHGLGMLAVRRNLGGLPEELLKNRMRHVVDDYKTWEPKQWAYRSAVERLANAARPTSARTVEELIRVADAQGLEMLERDEEIAGETARVLDAALESKSLERGIDFADMLWLPYQLGLPIPAFDLVLADECLIGRTPIFIDEDHIAPIEKIVAQKYDGTVMSFDERTGKSVRKRVIGWHKIPLGKKLVRITTRRTARDINGERLPALAELVKYRKRFVICTEDHRIYANGKWVFARDLCAGDCLIEESHAPYSNRHMNKSKISVEGRKQLSREMDKKNRSGECGNHTGTTHGVFVHRGGNGTGLTRYQQALLDRLGEEWIPEFVIKINSHPYKVDLAHAERKIVIELDGTSHNMPARARQDRRKDLGLKKLGWDVIRITNAESVQLTDDLLRERVANSPVESVVFAVDPWTPDDPYVYDITVEDTHCYYADGVLVHNCQDLSPIQHWMALEASKHGRMLICGDRNQAIYGWRSAHANSMDALAAGVKSRGGGVRELQLTYTRRCPKSHVELAQRLVPRIQALDSAPQGTVLHAQTVRQLVAQAKPGDFVLSRLNASLLETAQEFWKAGKPAMVKGREAQAGVMRLYDAAMSKGAVTMRGVVANAQEIAGGEIAKFLSMPEGRGESRAQQSQDRLYCLLALAGDTYDIPVFKRRLAELFGDEADGKKVVLSTIHRAKGLESTGVHILTKKLPHPSAKEGWQREQEDNLIYVALTRGKGDAVMSFVGPDIPGCEERDNA